MKREYIELSQKTIDRIEEITLTDYEIKDCKVLVENCVNIIEDLIIEYDNLLEEYNDYKEKETDRY